MTRHIIYFYFNGTVCIQYVMLLHDLHRTKDKASQLDMFWKSVDFGYIQERRQELKTICSPKTQVPLLLHTSTFICSTLSSTLVSVDVALLFFMCQAKCNQLMETFFRNPSLYIKIYVLDHISY